MQTADPNHDISMFFKRRGPRGGRQGFITLALASALAIGGVGTIGVAMAAQQHAPQPTTSTAGVLPNAHTPSGRSSPAPVLPYATPRTIQIPAIAVRSSINTTGLREDGTIDVPKPGPAYDTPAWYTGSPAPGQLGTAVIVGHVDSARHGPSVFYRLGALHPGDIISVTRSDHHVAVFRVNAVRRYPKDHFPSATVYQNTSHPSLRLITCGGDFDRAAGSYTDNIVVFAVLATTRPG